MSALRRISLVGPLLAVALLCGLPQGAAAQTTTASARMRVEGDRLIYDTSAEVDGEAFDIRYADVSALRDILRDTPGIRVLEINSAGGEYYPSTEIAALVIDFGLDTHVENTCESSCVPIFLGGAKRTMARGARIGFHQLAWNSHAVEDYYAKHREGRGWETPFDFAQWLYEDTQTETYNRLSYMVARGVDAQFAIQTIRKPDTTMWFPYRSVLMAAGVLTE